MKNYGTKSDDLPETPNINISIICTTDNKAQIFLCKNDGNEEQLALYTYDIFAAN